MAEQPETLAQLSRVRQQVLPELGKADVERLIAGAARRRERRRIRRSLGLGLAIGAVSASLLWLLVRMPPVSDGPAALVLASQGVNSVLPPGSAVPPAQLPSSSPRTAGTWELSDRSKALALGATTDIVIEEDSPERARLRLERGRARFHVERRPERTFIVQAGGVSVRVIGTVFEVEVVADRIGVVVDQGAVEVAWDLGKKRLVAGERGWFPPLVLGGGDAAVAGALPATPAATSPAARAVESSQPPASRAGTSARELLAESDAARTRGEPALGAELLRRILREHPTDARAPLAAFTLGRLLLNELGKPREAAAAFHEVQVRAPGGQFAEDALAREAEAWKQAAEPARARAVAETYLQRYPSGRHLRRVKALAGLE